MNPETIRNLLPLYRADRPVESRIRKAVQAADADDTLRRELQEQVEFDRQMIEVIHCIKPAPSLRQKLNGGNGRPKSRASQALNPAILGAIFGLLLIIGVGVHFKLEADKDFPGRDWVEAFIQLNDHMTGAELEETNQPAGELADNLMLRGFDGFTLPPEIASLPAVGWRVFRHGSSGHKVVQLAIDRNNSLVFVFRSSDFGVQPGESGDWKIFEHEGWAAAIRQHNGLCILMTFRGTESEMQTLIHSLKP